jgi:hypothetical protein
VIVPRRLDPVSILARVSQCGEHRSHLDRSFDGRADHDRDAILLISGGFDLSGGSTLAFTGVVTGLLTPDCQRFRR